MRKPIAVCNVLFSRNGLFDRMAPFDRNVYLCRISVLILTLFFCTAAAGGRDRPPIPLADYLSFARSSADWTWEHRDSLEAVWRQTLDPENVFGYRPPGRFLEMAAIYATLYDMEGTADYADRAKSILLKWGHFRKAYPDAAAARRTDYNEGIPALPDFFTTMRYIRPYETLKRKGVFRRSEMNKIEDLIAHSLDYTLRTQEWGPMNRTILRAEALAWAVRALPDHPSAKRWRTYEQALAFDNWGNWEIEDATIYHAVWLYSLIGYADAKYNLEGLFRTPEMVYYAHYFLNLMCPDGMVPDFGDAHWRANWNRFLVFFEAAAAAYHDPALKWAAATIGSRFLDLKTVQNTSMAYLLLDAYRWGTDNLQPEPPSGLSMEVMEDIVGKKIVFRNGWDPSSTYCLVNYRDEGDGGLIFRDYLRDTIPVEEEKMTHGHADENSIVLLMKDGSVLLHDGGYRDYMPSGPYGAYRQDYFHNRLCVRQEKIWMGQEKGAYRYAVPGQRSVPGQSVLDFLHNAGSYRIVRTQKIDFLTFTDFDYSRTRLIDDKMGYEWDRVVVYVKHPELFIVFDILKARVEEFFTACNLWHTRQIVDRGEHWFDTAYDSLRQYGMSPETRLFITFPKTHYTLEHAEPEHRNYQNEWVISQTKAQHFELGQHIGFISVLIPHHRSVDPLPWLDKIRFVNSEPENEGMAVEIVHEEKTIILGVKCDLRRDMVRDWRRPKYTYASGALRFGDFESNGDFFFTQRTGDRLAFTVVNLTRAVYGDQVLFDQPPSFFGLAYDGSPDAAGTGKARYWRDEVALK